MKDQELILPDGTIEPPVTELGTAQESGGLLVQVSIKVFAVEEVVERGIWPVLGALSDQVANTLEPTGRPIPQRSTFALYWGVTPDHDEDWFVVARSAELAALFFEEHDGYDPGDRTPRWAADALTNREETGWPSDDEIRASGGEFLPFVPDELRQDMGVVSKAVRFGERIYVSGDVVANQSKPETNAIN